MTWGLVAVAGATLVGGYLSSSNSSDAASQAAQTQSQASGAEIAERQRQFNVVRDLLQPWVTSGTTALGQQGDLIGLNGAGPQQAGIDSIRNGPQFSSLQKTGENAILQNASATGGLRGGNVNAALGQYDQSILTGLIDQQYGRLSGIAGQGQNAAAGVGAAAISTGTGNAASIGEAAAAQAGGILGGANASNGFINSAVNAAGIYAGGSGGLGARYYAPANINQSAGDLPLFA